MTRSARDKVADAAVHAKDYQQGYRAGLTGGYVPNPWDGRIKAGREWRKGYLAGMDARAQQSQSGPLRERVEAVMRIIDDARKEGRE